MRCRGRAWVPAAALVSVVASACVRQPVTVSPQEIHRHIRELRRDGRARVELSTGGTYELSADRALEVEVASEMRKVGVRQLIESCPDVRPYREDPRYRDRSCLLLATTSEEIRVDSKVRVSPEKLGTIIGLALGLVVVGAVIGYVGSCSGPEDGC